MMMDFRYFLIILINLYNFPTFNAFFIPLSLINWTLTHKIVYIKRNFNTALGCFIQNRDSILIEIFLLNIFCIIINAELSLRLTYFFMQFTFFAGNFYNWIFDYINLNRLFDGNWTLVLIFSINFRSYLSICSQKLPHLVLQEIISFFKKSELILILFFFVFVNEILIVSFCIFIFIFKQFI